LSEPDNQPPHGGQPPTPADSFKCPHCGHAYVVQIRAREVVAIGKCPNCGELIAPAKKN
jgi:predicted RNA-binding Zn-ribbon protein involved in translation (DUF1610 family)